MTIRTVLITGAGSGFGRGVALGLARQGHRVIAACHIWPQVTELRAEAAREGVEMRVIKLDVLSEIDRNHALSFDFDVLFNNAGIMESGPVAELPADAAVERQPQRLAVRCGGVCDHRGMIVGTASRAWNGTTS